MSKKVPDRMPASTVTDAKELKFCMQGESNGRIEYAYKLTYFTFSKYIRKKNTLENIFF